MERPKLSVVIPAYNESKNIEKGALSVVFKYLNNANLSFEVVIIDDGSSDRTAIQVEEQIKGNKKFRLIKNPHKGKAWTVMTGMLASKGEITLFTDMDQATPINQLEKLIPEFEKGFDIVIGSRQGRKGAPLLRKIAAWGFSVLRGLILGLPFVDTQCGFKAFNRKSIEKIIPKIKHEWGVLHTAGGAVNAGFDVELLYLAKKYGFQIAEVPVEWNYVDTERVQVLKDALAAIYDMLRIRINDLKKRYN